MRLTRLQAWVLAAGVVVTSRAAHADPPVFVQTPKSEDREDPGTGPARALVPPAEVPKHTTGPAQGAAPAPGAKTTRMRGTRRPIVVMRPPETLPEGNHPIRLALSSGYGFELGESVSGVNPFRVSFGVRGGYYLGPVYVGTRFLFFLGEAHRSADGNELSADEWLLGFEGGYGWRAGPLTLRPELGLGLAISSSEGARRASSAIPVPVDTSSEDPYLELGVVLELDLSRRLFFAAEARGALVLGKRTATSDGELFGLFALGSVGLRF